MDLFHNFFIYLHDKSNYFIIEIKNAITTGHGVSRKSQKNIKTLKKVLTRERNM